MSENIRESKVREVNEITASYSGWSLGDNACVGVTAQKEKEKDACLVFCEATPLVRSAREGIALGS